MKQKITLLFLCFLMIKANAQHCISLGHGEKIGTKKKPYYSAYSGYSFLQKKLQKSANELPCKSATLQVFFHVMKNGNDPNSGLTNQQTFIDDLIQNINAIFINYKIDFTKKGNGWQDEQNAQLYLSYNNTHDVAFDNNVTDIGKFENASVNPNTDALDIYLYFNATQGTPSGIAPIGGSTIVLFGNTGNESASDYTKTLVHQIGHIFGLEHTFYGTACINLANDIPYDMDVNYKQFFGWLTHIATQPNWLPPTADVYSLAIKCPLTNGNVVFAARNLYNALTHQLHSFTDDCGGNASARGMRKGMTAAAQNVIVKAKEIFRMYPNPTKNAVNIVSSKPIKSITIYNFLGEQVLNRQGINSAIVQLNNLQLQSGFYYVKTIFQDNSVISEKLVIYE